MFVRQPSRKMGRVRSGLKATRLRVIEESIDVLLRETYQHTHRHVPHHTLTPSNNKSKNTFKARCSGLSLQT